jgi:hypothetical protein
VSWRDTAAPAAAGLEALAGLAAIRGAGPVALALHAASCGCIAVWLHDRVVEGTAAWSLVLGVALFVPVLGALGLAAIALVPCPAVSPPAPDLVRTRIPGAAEAFAATPQETSRRRDRSGSEARLAAVAAARARTDPSTVALLLRALEDPEEDVRLLAHALLEAKSRTAYRSIHDATRRLEAAPRSTRGAAHQRLAFEHWELAWLGLAQRECLEHVLAMARRHALAALEEEPARAPLHFLLGRIELRRGDPQAAEAALLRAANHGVPAALVQPYLAEVAFLRRRFDLVRRRLAHGEPALGNVVVERLRRYWACA